MMHSDYEKPSRQDRRQKRSWRRKRQGLTRFTSNRHTLSPVLNTPLLAVSAPVSQSGFFTSIGFCRADFASTASAQWPGSAQPYNSLRAKSASRLTAVFKYLAALLNKGRLLNDLLGAIMAITIKPCHAGTERKPRLSSLAFRLAAYRGLRHITGPVLAHRIAFGLGGAHHG